VTPAARHPQGHSIGGAKSASSAGRVRGAQGRQRCEASDLRPATDPVGS
jgi:hypothetical protein